MMPSIDCGQDHNPSRDREFSGAGEPHQIAGWAANAHFLFSGDQVRSIGDEQISEPSEPGFFDYLRPSPPPRDSCHWKIKGKKEACFGMSCDGYYCPEHRAVLDRLKANNHEKTESSYGMYGSGYEKRGFS